MYTKYSLPFLTVKKEGEHFQIWYLDLVCIGTCFDFQVAKADAFSHVNQLAIELKELKEPQ